MISLYDDGGINFIGEIGTQEHWSTKITRINRKIERGKERK